MHAIFIKNNINSYLNPILEGDDPYPTDEDGNLKFSNVDYLDTWKAMEQLIETGLVKNIGVCNFNSKQLTRIIENCKVKPVVNQIECHPYLTQIELSKFCKKHGILIAAVSPFGTPDRPYLDPMSSGFLQTPEIKRIAERHKKKPNQIFLRYQVRFEFQISFFNSIVVTIIIISNLKS